MSDSIFDWDEEEKEPEKPASLIPYEPTPDNVPAPVADESLDTFDIRADPLELEPPAFEYSSDPFQPPPPSSVYPDPFLRPADTGAEPPADESGPFSYGSQNYYDRPIGMETSQYPLGYEPEPFAPLPPASEYQPESKEETSRRSGLAFSAGIVFFSSVVFMLFLGWIADWLIGSSPWGLVGGIVLGSVIGLIQFVRITSRIFNSDKSEAAMRPLLPPDDDL